MLFNKNEYDDGITISELAKKLGKENGFKVSAEALKRNCCVFIKDERIYISQNPSLLHNQNEKENQD